MYKSMNLKNGCSVRGRRGSVLVEFALIALILYLILAATIEFGRALMAAQLLQQAADIAVREVADARTARRRNPDGLEQSERHQRRLCRIRERISRQPQ